ncbi:hypothetical protein ZIOFF_073304 [Zingiber officinale]|uniref:dUTP diphosphatase n=1 Tax=Zingiber officinale TaxID=94328 RepID=A0A8J5EA51_ZINOF|nr:hypothetical protein ZIOFF_073304 [Zingiber officinale]
MSYINTQSTNSYKEALQATEAIEAPSIGFCRPADHKGAISGIVVSIKQANTQIQDRAALVPAEVLYHSRRDDAHHSVYVHQSEEAILVTTNQVDRSFIQEDSFHQLQRSRMRFIHMGIIQISILARGYEGWRNGEANVLITRGMVGRLSNTPNVGFAYEVQNVVDYLASHGVRALPGRRYSTREFMGQNWIIRPSTINIPIQPTEVTTNTLIDGRISMQFENYQTVRISMQPEYNMADQEIDNDEERMHLVAVLLSEQDILVAEPEEILYIKKRSATAQTPKRKSKGAVGYDLAIDQDYTIPPRGQELLSTGISIQVPKGTYARIASRSSYALQGLIIGAGVIDSDFRGEVKIIVYNFSDNTLFLKTGEAVTQLILECCKNSLVMPVRELSITSRGERGFGSTSPDKAQRILDTEKRRAELLQARKQKQQMNLENRKPFRSAKQYRQEILNEGLKYFTPDNIWDLLQPHSSTTIEEPEPNLVFRSSIPTAPNANVPGSTQPTSEINAQKATSLRQLKGLQFLWVANMF